MAEKVVTMALLLWHSARVLAISMQLAAFALAAVIVAITFSIGRDLVCVNAD